MRILDKIWYQNSVSVSVLENLYSKALIPFSFLYAAGVQIRKKLYQAGIFKQVRFAVPVVVVGNLTVGGTGKTPLVIHIAEYLQAQGWKPGVVSRGYKGNLKSPTKVQKNSDPRMVGDEAVLLARRLDCPVVVGKNRCAAVQYLLSHADPIDVIISDDGLQHYALHRDIEIVVKDAQRHFGNGYCLPAGPLREPISRLKTVDLIYETQYTPNFVYNALEPTLKQPLAFFKDQTVHAVAGIGNPERFFQLLRTHGIRVIPHLFPDHYLFKARDLRFDDQRPLFMTEKDVVKCTQFLEAHDWVVSIQAVVAPAFDTQLLNLLTKGRNYG